MEHANFITDAQLLLSDDQAVTATAISENVIKNMAALSAGATPGATRGLGIPVAQSSALPQFIRRDTVPIMIKVTGAFSTLTSLTVTLESDSVAALSSSPTVHWTSGAIGVATLVAGYAFLIDYLPEGEYQQYLGLRYTVGGSNAGAGSTLHAEVGRNVSTGERGVW